MPFSENARVIIEKFYLKKDKKGNLLEKKAEEIFERVAGFVSSVEKNDEYKKRFKEELINLMQEQKFMFSSPTHFNAGSDFPLSSSCFVGNLEDSMESIMKSASDTAMTFKAGAGMGLNFGLLRPKGSHVGRGGTSSGPVSFMRLFDEVGETVKSGGVRRAAFMAMMDVTHPDIEEFIISKDYLSQLNKQKSGTLFPDDFMDKIILNLSAYLSNVFKDSELCNNILADIRKRLFEPLSNMNISVAVNDEFMKSVKNDSEFTLDFDGVPVKKVSAKELFHLIALCAWRTADPGVWFIDRANEFDTVPHIGKILSTNPCGEQSLHNYTSCNLGSINLNKFINSRNDFDFDEFKRVIGTVTRALDNVIDVSAFPTADFKNNTLKIRPIGLGFTGLAEVLYRLGISYNSSEGIEFSANIARIMTQATIESSVDLAAEKGSFPVFDENKEALISIVKKYYDNEDEKKDIEKKIRKNGIRNSNWTTLAPTGTISLILDAYTYSLEPQFALAYNKNLIDGGVLTYVDPEFEKIIKKDKKIIKKVVENGGSCQGIDELPDKIKKVFVVAHDISYNDRIRMQAALQRYISNSISSTINLPNKTTADEIESLYLSAWESGLKGITIYRDGTKSFQPMTTQSKKEPLAVGSPKQWQRPKVIKGDIHKTKTGSGTLYTSVGIDEIGSPIEIFINISKHGSDVSAFSEALGRVVSIALQSGVSVDKIADTIIGITGDSSAWDNGKLIKSVPDAVGRILKEYANKLNEYSKEPTLFEKKNKLFDNDQISEDKNIDKGNISGASKCPVCGEKAFIKTEDCKTCLSCGYSKCG